MKDSFHGSTTLKDCKIIHLRWSTVTQNLQCFNPPAEDLYHDIVSVNSRRKLANVWAGVCACLNVLSKLT